MAAEELGIPYDNGRVHVADTASLGHNDMTDGSRGTFSSGMATIVAARNAIKVLCARAAKMWDIRRRRRDWEDGHAKPAGANAGNFPPLSIKEIAAGRRNTGGPIAGHNEFGRRWRRRFLRHAYLRHRGRPGNRRTKVMRYTVIQDAGKAIHPDYVEGQYQGGAAQGIGWALNEEYIYGKDGRLQNAGFLDYRIPVCSDLPFIDTDDPGDSQPQPSLWRARRRRNLDRAAAGGDRQRRVERGRRAHDAYPDVAAAHAEGDQERTRANR